MFRSLRFKLIVVVIIAAAPAWALLLQMASRERERETEAARERTLRVARLISQEHWRVLESAHGVLMTLAQMPALKNGDMETAHKHMLALHSAFPSYYETFGFADLQGNILLSAVPTSSPLNIRDRPYYVDALEKRNLSVGTYQIGRSTGKPAVNLGYPVETPNGEVIGVVYAAVSLGWLQQMLSAAEFGDAMKVTVSDANGTVLASYPLNGLSPGQPVSEQKRKLMERDQTEGATLIERAKDSVFFAWVSLDTPSNSGRVFVSVSMPRSIVMTPLTRTFVKYLVWLAAAAVITIAGTWYVGETRVVQPVKQLIRSTRSIAAGDLSARAPAAENTGGEIRELATTFNEMAASLQRTSRDLEFAYDETLDGWARALEFRDKETIGHTLRVTEVTVRLARAMNLSEEEILHIRRGALLHDIGKMGVPDAILFKNTSLTEQEWSIMRKHPIFAYDLLFPIEYLRPALDIPYCHHERWDGKGYPRGLAGTEIPLAARIFAVVDAWDALRHDRPYRQSWRQERVLGYLQANSGTAFDPKVVDAFVAMEEGIQQAIADADFVTSQVTTAW